MSDLAPVRDPYAAILVIAYLDHTGHVCLKDDGKFLLRLTRKQAAHLIANLAVTLAEGLKDA